MARYHSKHLAPKTIHQPDQREEVPEGTVLDYMGQVHRSKATNEAASNGEGYKKVGESRERA
jgi:hypothetical protein